MDSIIDLSGDMIGRWMFLPAVLFAFSVYLRARNNVLVGWLMAAYAVYDLLSVVGRLPFLVGLIEVIFFATSVWVSLRVKAIINGDL